MIYEKQFEEIGWLWCGGVPVGIAEEVREHVHVDVDTGGAERQLPECGKESSTSQMLQDNTASRWWYNSIQDHVLKQT